MPVQIRLRNDTAVNWTEANPVLALGEFGLERNTGQFKIGDGTSTWTALPYGGIVGPTGATGPTGADSTVPGPAGPQGEPGQNGVDGTNGTNGADGAEGPQGPTGEKGDPGSIDNLNVTSPILYDEVTSTLSFDDTDYATIEYVNNEIANLDAASVVVSTTAPATPSSGDLWFNSENLVTYIYYDSFWVELSPAIAGPAGADGVDGANGADGADGTDGASGGITLNVTNSGFSSYTINGASNPTISFIRGHRYIINVNAPGHPFWIQTVSGAYSSENEYNTGVTNNGTDVGTIIVEVPFDAPQLYYVCQFHSSMAGSITVSNLGPTGETGPTGATGDPGGFDSTQVVENKTSFYSVISADAGKLITNSGAGTAGLVVAMPDVLAIGQQVDFLRVDSGTMSFDSSGGSTLLSKDGNLAIASQYSPASIKCVAAGVYILLGDLGA
jgi:hypothetical protein